MKKSLFKLYAFIFAFVLSISVFAGCFNEQPTEFSQSPELSVWAQTDGFSFVIMPAQPDADYYGIYWNSGHLTDSAAVRQGNWELDVGLHGKIYLPNGDYSVVAVAFRAGFKDVAESEIQWITVSAESNGSNPVSQFTSKRGVGYGFTTANSDGNYDSPSKRTTRTTTQDMDLLTSGTNPVSWFYNWGGAPGYDTASRNTVAAAAEQRGLMYMPMAWDAGSGFLTTIRSYITSRLGTPHEVEYILAYNEPNFRRQSNLTPQAAGNAWPQFVALAKEFNLKIVSPAMNFSGGEEAMGWNNPIAWLDAFFAHPNVNINDIHAISMHTYSWYPANLRYHVNLYKKYGKPIWVTEFCGWEDRGSRPSSTTLQAWYMGMGLTYLEQDNMVEKYAWYLPKGHEPQNNLPHHNLLTDVVLNGTDLPQLTHLGRIYTNLSSFDKTVWAPVGQRIEAEHMTANNQQSMASYHYTAADVAALDGSDGTKLAAIAANPRLAWQEGVTFRVSTDPGDHANSLNIFDFRTVPTGGWPYGMEPAHEMWVEYQIQTTESRAHSLQLRYQTTQATTMHITVNGQTVPNSPHALNSASFTTGTFDLGMLSAGRHTIRLRVSSGNCALNWLRVV
ncbi:MAG: glycosyl hydrolase [Firmicutes bacterium]|nr:glycosyl hydrolase [Bacillota bacterium]